MERKNLPSTDLEAGHSGKGQSEHKGPRGRTWCPEFQDQKGGSLELDLIFCSALVVLSTDRFWLGRSSFPSGLASVVPAFPSGACLCSLLVCLVSFSDCLSQSPQTEGLFTSLDSCVLIRSS